MDEWMTRLNVLIVFQSSVPSRVSLSGTLYAPHVHEYKDGWVKAWMHGSITGQRNWWIIHGVPISVLVFVCLSGTYAFLCVLLMRSYVPEWTKD